MEAGLLGLYEQKFFACAVSTLWYPLLFFLYYLEWDLEMVVPLLDWDLGMAVCFWVWTWGGGGSE